MFGPHRLGRAHNENVRAMSISDLLNFLGALGLFLVGMKVMSDALMRLAGDSMRRLMSNLTANRFLAAFTGLTITGLIQSSSATTLMVVSFVNAGLLRLTEALGVIMGANIGTTLTAWLIAILGFSVSMVDIALPMMVVGFLFFVREDRRARTFGGFVIGFCLLFIGLDFMKESVPDLQENQALMVAIGALHGHGFLSLIVFALLGTVLTLILQSSSATMAITLVAVSQGVLPFGAACAIILGENIGTTITANMAAMVSGTNARRAALGHLIFNVIGVAWVLALYAPFLELVNWLAGEVQGGVPMNNPSDAPMGLAVFHTTFNVINTLLLIGFIDPLARFVTSLLPEGAEPVPDWQKPRYLDARALKYPETGLHALTRETLRLYRGPVLDMVQRSIDIEPVILSRNMDKSAILSGSQTPLETDFATFANDRIHPIYRALAAYGADLQRRHDLNDFASEKLNGIEFAARDALLLVGSTASLAELLHRVESGQTNKLRGAVDLLRGDLLDFLCRIHSLDFSETPEDLNAEFAVLTELRVERDKIRAGHIETLYADTSIPPDEIGALFAASTQTRHICKRLVGGMRNLSSAPDEAIDYETGEELIE